MQSSAPDRLHIGAWTVAARLNTISRNGTTIRLEPKVMHVLLCLVEAKGDVVTKEELFRRVWPDTFVTDDVLKRCIVELRKAFGDDAQHSSVIETIPRVGYRLIADIGVEAPPAPVPTPPISPSPKADAPAASPEYPQISSKFAESLKRFGVLFTMALLAFGVWKTTLLFNERPTPGSPRVVPLTSMAGFEDYPSFSPDGRQIVFGHAEDTGKDVVIPAKEGAAGAIYVQTIGDERAVAILEDGGRCPAWSPDGRWIAYNRYWKSNSTSWWNPEDMGTAVAIMSPLGGSHRDIVQISPRFQCTLSWSPDNRWLAFAHQPEGEKEGLFIASIEDGRLQRVTTPPPGVEDEDPAFSEDGTTLAFVRRTSWATGDIYLVRQDGSGLRRLTQSNSNVGGPLWEAGGEDLLYWSSPSGSAWSSDLYRINVNGGSAQKLPFGSGDAGRPAIARSTNRLAYAKFQLDVNLYSVEVGAFDHPTRINASSRIDLSPTMSHNRERLAFISDRDGALGLWISDPDGTHPEKVIPLHQGGSPAWSPDDRFIAYDTRDDGHSRISVVNVATHQVSKLTNGPYDDVVPNWSADGRFIYYSSYQNGAWNISRVPSTGGAAAQLTQHGALHPVASPDGKYIYFAKPGAQPSVGSVFEERGIWRMPVSGHEPELVLSAPDAPIGWAWTISSDSIYFMTQVGGRTEVKRFDLRSRRVQHLGTLDKLLWNGPGLDVSPDGRTFYFSTVDSASSDIVLVDDYR